MLEIQQKCSVCSTKTWLRLSCTIETHRAINKTVKDTDKTESVIVIVKAQ